MNNIKKCILVLSVTLVLFVVCSLSSFAVDVNFFMSNSNRPALQYTNSRTEQIITSVLQNADGDYYLVDWVQHYNSPNNTKYYFGENFFFNCGSLANSGYVTTPDGYLYQGFVYNTASRPGYGLTMPFEIYIYDVSGELVKSWNFNLNYSIAPGIKFANNYNGNGSLSGYEYLTLLHPYDYVPLTYSSTFSDVNTYYFNNSSSYTDISSLIDSSQSMINSSGSVYSTIEDNIYIDGTLVYGSGSDDGNLASKIIGKAIGSISFPDGNGGTTTGDVDIDVNLDFPDYSGDYNTVTLPENPTISEPDLDSFDGLEWFVNFFNTICTTNSKIFALILLSLSIGVATLILNKKR